MVSLEVDSLAVNPQKVVDKKYLANRLASKLSHFQLSQPEIIHKLKTDSKFVWIKRQLDPEISASLKQLNLPGVEFRKEKKRYYPQGNLASHLMGAVSIDGYGLSGVELIYDKLCKNLKNKEIDIVLCIDTTLQYIAEKELRNAFNRYRPKKASVVIQNPYTGEILALACLPSFVQNNYNFTEKDLVNPVVNEVFEPGSTFKIITTAAALAEKIYRPKDAIFCENGCYDFTEGLKIRDHEKY
ncbi:unnamed protein product, partial [marine sediment metagenome]